MRKTLIVAAMVLAGAVGHATGDGYEALFPGPYDYGGYGGAAVSRIEVAEDRGTLVGLRAGWILNRSHLVGIGLYGLSGDVTSYRVAGPDTGVALTTGYAGVEYGYICRTRQVFHAVFSLLTGLGSAEYRLPGGRGGPFTDDYLVVRPEIALEVNLTRTFRLRAGAGYLATAGLDLGRLEDGDIGGLTADLTLLWGSF